MPATSNFSKMTEFMSLFAGASTPANGMSSSLGNWQNTAKLATLHIASYLNDPICKVREYFYTFYTLDEICETTAQKVMKAFSLTLGIAVCVPLTLFTTPIGVALRGTVATVASKPYIYLKKAEGGKVLPEDKKISIAFHNQCYMFAGFSISDGQVTPPSDTARVDANIRNIKRLKPDIAVLCEVGGTRISSYLSSQLTEYPFIIPIAGLRGIGPTSMLYIASKYEIDENSIEFVPFIKGVELTGRGGQYAEKGFLSFDIKNPEEENSFATIIATHMQHSEICTEPDESEIQSRAAQMRKIAKQIEKKVAEGRNVIFTGDLNLDEKELDTVLYRNDLKNRFLTASALTQNFDPHSRLASRQWSLALDQNSEEPPCQNPDSSSGFGIHQNPTLTLRRDPAVQGKPTWGGNGWCAKLMGIPPSGPLVLDYTFIAGKAKAISTKIIGTGYSGDEFRPKALSDHNMLLSTVTLG